jgi:hypothetical protein
MTLAELAQSINKRGAMCRFALPEMGYLGAPVPAMAAKADVRRKRLAWVMSGRDDQEAYDTQGAFVRDIIETRDFVRVIIDAKFPVQAADFISLDSIDTDARDAFFDAYDDYDDYEMRAAADMARDLEGVSDYPDPKLTKTYTFVRWYVLSGETGNLEPRGIVMVSPRKQLITSVFPGFEAEGTRWRGQDVHPNVLEKLSGLTSRNEYVSAPEWIKAESFEDAQQRAIYAFGVDWFKETGRSMF